MLASAAALSILTVTGFIMVYNKFPGWLRKFVEKHSLMTDIIVLVGVYALLGGTLTALFAGAICGILTSALLHIANNKEDYMFLSDFWAVAKKNFKLAQQKLLEYGKFYREQKGIKEIHEAVTTSNINPSPLVAV